MLEIKDKVVYQIYPRSFMDSDGDGFGDLKGVTGRLDYLKDLGVDLLWLTPFFVSPQRDNGYDVADYRRIDPRFGTMEDLEELVAGAKEKGMGLMLDMVFNHTSTRHEWFQRALRGEKEYQDYYIFKDGSPDTPPTNWVSKFGGNAWEYVPSLKKWYLHLFDVTQADLNWENPRVREELKDILRFWKEKGIAGFRFDVVNLISKADFEDASEDDGRSHYTDGPKVHEYLREMVADAGIGDMVTVGEMSSTSIDNCIRYAGEDAGELSMVFHFQHLKVDYKNGDKWSLMKPDLNALKTLFMDWQTAMQENHAWDALFWDNHDQPRALSRFGNEGEYRTASAKMLAGVLHLLRGTPYIYQGDEIGMANAHFHDISRYRDVESRNYYEILRGQGCSEDEALSVIDERSRDNCRTPMQWNAEKNAGFTTGTPWIDVNEDYKIVNAKAQNHDEKSIYSFYKQLIRLRKSKKVISHGRISFMETPDEVIAYVREWEGKKLFVYGNMSAKEMECRDPFAKGDLDWRLLIGNYGDTPTVKEGMLYLRPFEFAALELS